MKQLSGPLAERNMTFWGDTGQFLANSGYFCGREQLCDVGITFWPDQVILWLGIHFMMYVGIPS